VAAGIPTVPEVATPPVPTFTVNADVPLELTIEGEVPKPALMTSTISFTPQSKRPTREALASKVGHVV
jgi:hypothetical protein